MHGTLLRRVELLHLTARTDHLGDHAAVLSTLGSIRDMWKHVRVSDVLSGRSLRAVRVDGTTLLEEMRSHAERVDDDDLVAGEGNVNESRALTGQLEQ